MALDALDEIGVDPERIAERREELLNSAASVGMTIPDELPGPQTSAIYASLNAEMKLAQSIVNGTYGAVGLHVKRPDADHVGFHTRLEPGPLTEMIASACVIAQLELLKRGAKLFGWTIDEESVDDLLERARELNEASANPESAAASTDPIG